MSTLIVETLKNMDGSVRPFSRFFESAPMPITQSSATPLAHGLGQRPKLWTAHLVCAETEQGYAVGDEIDIPWNYSSNTNYPLIVLAADATNLTVTIGSLFQLYVPTKTGSAAAYLTNAKWRIVVRAWA